MTPRFKRDLLGNLVPDVRAAAAIVYNPQTGDVLWEENSHEQRSIASLTKVMTARDVRRRRPGSRRSASPSRAPTCAARRRRYLRAGRRASRIDDLLHLTLIASDNAAARVLARTSEGGTAAFVGRMNEMAAHLGLTNTHYADPSGLDPRNVSSAYDLSHLIAFAVGRAGSAPIMRTAEYEAQHEPARRFTIHSTNKLLGTDVDVRGGKTGFISKAGYCLATLLQVPQGSQVAVVVLGAANSTTRFWEARHLFNWVVGRTQGIVGGDPRVRSHPTSKLGRSVRVRAAVDWPQVEPVLTADARTPPGGRIAGRAPRLHVLMVASEVAPWAKTGGLATSLGALPDALDRPRPSTSRVVAAAVPRRRCRRRRRARPARARAARRARRRRACTSRRCRRAGASCSSTCRELFDRDGFYGAGRARLSRTTRSASRCSRPPRSTSPQRRRRRVAVDIIHAHDWQAGLVPALAARRSGRAGRALATAGLVFTIHNLAYQGVFPRDVVPALGLPWDVFTMDARRVLGPVQLPEGRHHVQRLRHDRQPDLRARDADAASSGAGLEGVLRGARRPLRRHPQRHRHRGLESGHRSAICPRTSTPSDLAGKADVQARAARALRLAARRRRAGAAARRAWCRGWSTQKGLDLDRAAAPRRWSTLDATWVFVGTGERALRDVAARAGRAASVARRRAHRVRRGARAPGRGRRRHVPDAVDVRAVRAESDVQPALRHGADRARGRRARRHDSAVHGARPARQRVQVPRGDAGRARAHGAQAVRLYHDRDGVAAADAATAWRRITPGRRRPGNMSKCTDGLARRGRTEAAR